MLYRITSTAGVEDGTGVVYLGIGPDGLRREIFVGGDPMDLTGEELQMVHQTGCQVEEVPEDGSGAAERAAKVLDDMIAAMPSDVSLETPSDDGVNREEEPVKPLAPTPASAGSPTPTAGPVPISPSTPNVPLKGV